MHKTYGTMTYYDDYCVAYVDDDLGKYYRSLVPKSIRINQQRYQTHLTVVRKNVEFPKNLEFWKKYAGQKVEIWYNPNIETCGTYYWLEAQSPDIEKIRLELGLPSFRHGDRYHITVGNVKHEYGFCKI